MTDLLLEVNNVSKRFCKRPELALRYAVSDVWYELTGRSPKEELREGEFWALRDVSFKLYKGEMLGVIGANGAGKSTLINLVAGLMRPTAGDIRLYTHKVALMDAHGGLNFVQTGRENIVTQLALHKCPPEEIERQTLAAIEFAEIGTFIDAAVGTYSLGMRLRLAFSIYTCLKPDLFIVDEALGGGDLKFRRKFQNFIKSYRSEGGSILYCSHELYTVQTMCRETLLLECGQQRMLGDTVKALKLYHDLMDVHNDELVGSSHVDSLGDLIETSQAETEEDLEYADTPAEVQAEANPKPDATLVRAEDFEPDDELEYTDNSPGSTRDSVTIKSLAIYAPNGGELQPAGPAEIKIVCHSGEYLEKVMIAVEIGQGSVAPIVTLIDGYGRHQYCINIGENTLVASIESLPLAPGWFDARCAISLDDGTGSTVAEIGYGRPAERFQVALPETKEFNMIMFRKNIMYVPAEWR